MKINIPRRSDVEVWGTKEDDPPTVKKPVVKLLGTDGNVFAIIGVCSKALKRAGQPEKAKEMSEKAVRAGSYHEAIGICMQYVEVR